MNSDRGPFSPLNPSSDLYRSPSSGEIADKRMKQWQQRLQQQQQQTYLICS